MVKDVKLLAIIALISVLCIGFVTAYTQEYTGSYTGNTGVGKDVSVIYLENSATTKAMTKFVTSEPIYIDAPGRAGYYTHPSGTLTGMGIYTGFTSSSSGTLVGNGSVTWSCGNSYLAYDNPCTFTYTITDLSSSLSGAQTIRFNTSSSPKGSALNYYICSDYYGCNGWKSTTTSPLGNNWAAYRRYATDGSIYNGTFTVYSGSAIAVNSSYTNLTVNAKAIGTSTNIYNTLVTIEKSDGSMNVGRTDVYGNVTFPWVATSTDDVTLDAYAVGYGYYSESTYKLLDANQFKQIYLTPQNIPNSTNYIRVNVLDSLTGNYLSDLSVNISVTDKNVSQTYYEMAPTGSMFVTLTGTSKNRPLYYNDYYNFAATATGYNTNNLTIQYTTAGQTADLYLTPSSAYLTPREMWVDVLDPATGEGNTVGGSTVKLYDAALNQWANSTTSTGEISLTMSGTNKQEPIVIGRNYTLCASATGYSQSCIGPFIFNAPYSNDNESVGKIPYQIGLTFSGVVPTGNFSVNVYTVDGSSYLAIQNVGVLASNGQGQTTSTGGVTQFILPAGTYNFKASKTGYTSATGVITGVAGDTKSLTIPMFENTITYATTSPTVAPTVTGVYGTARNTTPATCGGEYTNIIGYVKSYIACWGVSDRYSQDLALAAFIIIICLFFGSRYGKGLGAIIGAACGFVLSVAANLIDLWVFFALVIIAGLIFGLRLYTADK